jgi:hypothetical protein
MNRKYCGVINTQTNVLENIIVANIDTDLPYDGTYFIDMTQLYEDEEFRTNYGPFHIGCVYDLENKKFIDPTVIENTEEV